MFKFYRAKRRTDNMFWLFFLCHICARYHSMNSYKFQLRVHFSIIIYNVHIDSILTIKYAIFENK